MPSPFPGMNPYLEQAAYWQDFHTKFLAAINEQLVPQVRPKYVVILEQHPYVHELPPDGPRLAGRADLSLARTRAEIGRQGGAAVLVAPTEVQVVAQDVERVPFLEIRDRQGRELVTVLEMLSPSNKRGDDRQQYLAKREQLLGSTAHLIELDLLRGGRPMPSANRPDCHYSALVSRAEDRPRAGFWPIGLRERLPEIPSRSAARMEMRASTSRRSSTASTMPTATRTSSTTPLPEPPLSPEDVDWARQFVPPS